MPLVRRRGQLFHYGRLCLVNEAHHVCWRGPVVQLLSRSMYAREAYRGTVLIRNTPPVGPYSSPLPRDLW